ncbi:MAG: DNA recombination protein RmuC [Xanthobacteraceae bacterium]|nr:MAG: DNA recombination protein RmuC [Xanthobacteraceae bacterium]
MSDTLFTVGGVPVSVSLALITGIAVTLAALIALALAAMRAVKVSGLSALEQALRAEELQQRLGDMARAQSDTAGRVHAMGEVLAGRQAELARVMNERLDAVGHRVGQSMEQTTRHTMDSLRALHERLAVIDSAHQNLTELTSQVTTLRDVLANKQSRGAFGQARMEAIVQDGMPKGSYAFQYTLSNGKRPDCVVFLPDRRPLAIDAKFPLESVTALREARGEDERRAAGQRLRQDLTRHVGDIAGKYLIPGETQEMALMFVPSESVYADIYDGFDDVVQKAYRARVVLVSPSLLMLAIQVMQQILKDARMREAADQIRSEMLLMMDDLGRLRERVAKLQTHFGQVNEDVRQVLISADKIEKRAGRIEELDFSAEAEAAPVGQDGAAAATMPALFAAGEPRLSAHASE